MLYVKNLVWLWFFFLGLLGKIEGEKGLCCNYIYMIDLRVFWVFIGYINECGVKVC